MLTLHRKYNGVAKEPVLFVGDKGKSKELKGAKAKAWLEKLGKGVTLLATAGHSTDNMLLQLADQGVKLYTAHWHSTGIDKGLEPTEIAAAFSLVDESLIRPFKPRPDLRDLRAAVVTRNAALEYRKAAANQFRAAIRSLGVAESEAPMELLAEKTDTENLQAQEERPIEKLLVKLAKDIVECRLFNRVFGMKDGFVVAGQFVSTVGDMSRFPTVSAFWHYCGQHVVDGHAPKRARGNAVDWNPEARTVLWKTIDAALKNNIPTVRNLYEEFKAAELAVHDEKHPGCTTKLGHCGARARRRVTKELLKEYYSLAGGQGRPRE